MASEEVVEEDFFLGLFDRMLEKRNPVRASDDEISESIQKFVDYFRINRSAAGACAADRFVSNADYWGYFYWHSPLSAAATRNKALVAIRDCEKFRSCFNQKLLKVVSVGGGSGSDLVGLFSAIYKNSVFQDMFVHLVENISRWKLYYEELNKLLAENDFGDASQLLKNRRCFPFFIGADMRKAVIPDCKEALNEANLVWMKGFLSTLANDSERHDITEVSITELYKSWLDLRTLLLAKCGNLLHFARSP
ncbi:hypothetical protein AVEN_158288-1 [Araneus ventricosus]|uniref:Uncharacterized protein n=1 Tax=Araneus ventricosus TaxID=182803 RepID=A0A4Y2VRR2_ARAVE|nr:hypothetical protein AVEN_158288-1 [Araneus ventricosus]